MPILPGENFYDYQARMKREGLYNGGNGVKVATPVKTHQDSEIAKAYNRAWSLRKLPTSPIVEYFKDKVHERGYYRLDARERISSLPSEDHIHGISKANYHEKSWPTRLGIIKSDGVVVPHYFRSFAVQEGGYESMASKIITNCVFGRLYPTPIDYHIVMYNDSFGTFAVDLNNLEGVKSIRLDKYLQQKGIEFESVKSYLENIRNGSLREDLTDGAIAQLGLAGYSIPNAVGEQDPNTRNIILLGNDKQGEKFDSVVRIDFENSRTGQKNDNIADAERVYPMGIYGRDEGKHEYKENIIRALVDKEISSKEADFLLNLNTVTHFATRTTAIDNATTAAINDCRYADEKGVSSLPTEGIFTPEDFSSIAKDVIQRADNYTKRVGEYFEKGGATTPRFEDPIDMIPEITK